MHGILRHPCRAQTHHTMQLCPSCPVLASQRYMLRLKQPHSACLVSRARSNPLRGSTSSSGTRQTILRPPAAAATLSYDYANNSYLSDSRTQDASFHPVAPLPTPPTSSSDWGVLPYLWDLARAEKQLSWRMGAAFICMLMSKAAGVW